MNAIPPISASISVTTNLADLSAGSLLGELASHVTGTGQDTIIATISSSVSAIALASAFALPGTLTLSISAPLAFSAPSFGNASAPTPGKLIKAGGGTLTLSGVSSYTNGTEVQAGTLIGTPQSIFGNVTVDSGATLDLTLNQVGFIGTSTSGIQSSYGGGGISLNGGSAFIDFGGSQTLVGSSTSLGASTTATAAQTTLRNFKLGDYLELSNFTDPKNTTATVSGTTLQVQDTSGHVAYFGLSSSFNDSSLGDETVAVLQDPTTGNTMITPAMLVSSASGTATGAGSLRHALSVINGTVSPTNGFGDVILFDHTVSGQKISVGGLSGTTINTIAISATNVKFDVQSGDTITIDGVAPSGFNAPNGFKKNGGGTLVLSGSEINVAGAITVSGGTLDLETSQLGSVSLAFKTERDATVAGTSSTLNSKSVSNFELGSSIKVKDFTGDSSLTLNTSGLSAGLGSLVLSEATADGKSLSTTLTLSGTTTAVPNVSSSFVLLTDSTDGSALIRPSLSVTTATDLSNAIAGITSTGSSYLNTTGDVIDLTNANGTALSVGTLSLGSNKVLFDVAKISGNNASVTVSGALSGSLQKVGSGTLTLVGDESGLGVVSVGGGILGLGNTSTVSGVDLAAGHAIVSGHLANLNGLTVQNLHFGNGINVIPTTSGDTLAIGLNNGVITVTESGTTSATASITANFSQGSGFTTITDVASSNGRIIIPVITGTLTASPGQLGSFAFIDSGGTLDFTSGGFIDSNYYGTGTIAVDLADVTQEVKFSTSGNVPGIGSGGHFTGAVQVNTGIYDMTNVTPAQIPGTISMGLGAHSLLNVTQAELSHLNFTSTATGSAIHVIDLLPANASLATITNSSNLQLNLTGLSGSPTSLSFTVPGNTTLLSDGGSGMLIAIGNDTISMAASSITGAGSIGTSVLKPSVLSVTGSASGGILDLSTSTLGTAIKGLDVSGLANTTVKLNFVEASQINSITGSGSTTVQLVTDGATYDATNNQSNISGISGVDLSGHNETFLVGGGSPPTGLKFFHGNSDGTDSIKGATTTVDLRGIKFSGNGHIVGGAVDGSNNKLPTTFIVSDGNAIPHIDSYTGSDTINLVTTAQLGVDYTADDIGWALGHGFTLQLNGVTFPSGNFTPPGGGAASIINPVTSGAFTVGVSGSNYTMSGTLAATATHLVLPTGTNFDLSALSITGGSAANPIVLFGAPGSTVTLPHNLFAGGQTAIEFEVNAGNNTILAPGTAPVEIWGGDGNDNITLTSGPGTVVGGVGIATLNGGSSDGSAYSGTGTVILVGAAGGGLLTNGGDYSEQISGGGITTLAANPLSTIVGGLHQAFFGSQDTSSGALDTFNLNTTAGGAHNVVTTGAARAVVNVNASNDTIIAGGTGTVQVVGGSPGENLTFIAKQSSGGTEHATISGSAIGTLLAYGGDGGDSIAAGVGGHSTIIGGAGSDTFFGTVGNGYMLSQGSKDFFQFNGAGSTNPSAGTFFVEGFTVGTDGLQFTNNVTTLTSAQVTIAGSDLSSPTDSITSHLIGMTALQFTLSNGQHIDLVGISSLATGAYTVQLT